MKGHFRRAWDLLKGKQGPTVLEDARQASSEELDRSLEKFMRQLAKGGFEEAVVQIAKDVGRKDHD